MEKIGIIGSGTWGTAIAVLLRNNGHEVTLWSAIPAEIEEMAKTRTHKNLPGVTLPEGIIYTADLEEAMKDKNLLVMAVPSVFVRSTAQKMKPFCKEGQLIVDVAKGIEENTLDTMTQIIKEELPMAETAVLSGPSHAEEVSRGLPTLCVAGSRKKNVAEYVQSTFISPVFRVYTSPDVLGIETGAALKNVVALAAGIADGLGYGDNAKAALITRGMAEIARLGVAMGGKYQTYTGLSGIGDLIVTCASMHSRNRRAGILIGKGYTMEEAMKEVLDKYPALDGVFCTNADVSEMFLSVNKDTGDNKVAMVGVDATSKQQEAVKSGDELGILSQNPYAMGYQTMWAAIQATAPKKEVKIEKKVLLDPAWIDAENIESEDYANYIYN